MSLNYQIHHIYPLEIFSKFGDKLAQLFGLEDPKSLIQSYNNRIALFTDPAMAKAMQDLYRQGGLQDAAIGSTDHKGSHPDYTAAIGDKLRKLLDSDLPPEQKRLGYQDMSGVLWNMLQEGYLPLKADKAMILSSKPDPSGYISLFVH